MFENEIYILGQMTGACDDIRVGFAAAALTTSLQVQVSALQKTRCI